MRRTGSAAADSGPVAAGDPAPMRRSGGHSPALRRRRGLATTYVGSPRTHTDLEHLGFYVCVDDLEDELIRVVGAVAVEALFDSQGDLASFRSAAKQSPAVTRPGR